MTLSTFATKTGWLAPFCDLLCTRAIKRTDKNLAFRIGGERHPDLIHQKHWAAEAEACGIRPRFLQGLVRDSAQRLLHGLESVKLKFEAQYGPYPALQRVERVLKQQCGRILSND